MTDCLFCKIAAKEIPSDVVRETEDLFAFRDIDPQAPTHILAVPKRHVASLNDVADTELLGKLLLFARDIAKEEGLADRGYRMVLNTNADGGQTVFHVHVHLLGGRAMRWPPG